MTPEDTQFVDLVEEAIRASLASFPILYPGKTLAGYAIGTDDDLCTIFCSLADSEFCAAPPYPGAEFIFVEWPCDDDGHCFDAAQNAISHRYQSASDGGYFEAHVDATFACLVEALRRSRASGVLGPDMFVFVGSTDPGDHQEALALKAAEQLNTPQAFAGMRKAFGF